MPQRRLVAAGSAEHVALTLGGDGAVLASASGVIRSEVPKVTVISTVGAGDSFLAAFVLRLAQGRTAEEAFRAGVAAGSATASTPATELCHREDVERLEAELSPPGPEPIRRRTVWAKKFYAKKIGSNSRRVLPFLGASVRNTLKP
ncbi:PfkB family carbohydrate kinase [Cryobacterium breve]|uniref:PfkB family carbohydrate kinase n=1 Tax=Cryobacterium breve TaxID=1259258 RepID=UPI00248CC1F5|nr:PfkB family carbohydrate kinase [Cryobacterium breve]